MRSRLFLALSSVLVACHLGEVAPVSQQRPRADVTADPVVERAPGLAWAWVQSDAAGGRQAGPAYAPWGQDVISFECSAHVFTPPAKPAVVCRRYREGEDLWRFDADTPAASADVLLEGDTVFVAWTLEHGCEARAFSLETGDPRWTTALDCAGVVQLGVADGQLLVHDERGVSHALDDVTGSVEATARLPDGLATAPWREAAVGADHDAAPWSVRNHQLVRSDKAVTRSLPRRVYRTDEETRIRWFVEMHDSAVAVHERVDLPAYAMRWTHYYDFEGVHLGTRRVVSGEEHPGLWELHVVPERTLPPQ